MTREGVLRLVRRGRVRLEAMRLLRGAARGALAGGVPGLLVLFVGKLWLPVAAWIPWALFAVGAAAGVVAAAFGRAVGMPAAALFLDQRLETEERIVTLLTRDVGRFGERLLNELAGVGKLPRLRLPREVSLVPAALFLLFAVGLLPDANGQGTSPSFATAATGGRARAAAAGERSPPPDLDAAVVQRLERGEAPAGADVAAIKAVLDGLHLPEERSEAGKALERAAAGDGAEAKRVAKSLKAVQGGKGRSEPAAPVDPAGPGTDARGGAAVTAYPEYRDLVLAYRRALVEERNR